MSSWDKIASCAYQKKYNKAYYSKKRFSKQNAAWKRLVLNRDNNKCLLCDSTKRLQVHHIKRWIDDPILRFKVSNGATVCWSCHNKGHQGRGKPFDPVMTYQLECKLIN